MTENPKKGEHPDANGPDKEADDVQWEEIDFDELFGDEGSKDEEPEKTPARQDASEGPKQGTEEAPASPDDTPAEVLDDVLDFIEEEEPSHPESPQPAPTETASEPEEEPEVVSLEDLLEVEETSAKDEAPKDEEEETVAEAPAEVDIEDLLADDIASAEPGAGEEAEIAELEDLLAEDLSPSDEVAAEGAEPAEAAADEPTAELETGEDTADVEAPVPAGKKGKGLRKLGKKSKLGAAKGAGKQERSRKRERPLARAKEKGTEREPRRAGVGAGAITFVCSECYEELLLSPNHSQDLVTCPECLHVGKRPDDDFLRTVRMHKAGEHKSFIAAVVCGALLLLLVMAFFWTHSPYADKPADNLTLGLLAGSGILALVFLWLIWRFEGNRWEVYF